MNGRVNRSLTQSARLLNHLRVRVRVDLLARVRVRGGLSPALTSNRSMPTSQTCQPSQSIASYRSVFVVLSGE